MKKKSIHGLTHKKLVKLAARWLRNTGGCSAVLSEMVSQAEIPDAIGWRKGRSCLIECKANRKSFLADKLKRCRRVLGKVYAFGMGNRRYYMVPEGLVTKDEVPRGWGLLEVMFNGRVRCAEESATWMLPALETGHEMGLLLSALRRYQAAELENEKKPIGGRNA